MNRWGGRLVYVPTGLVTGLLALLALRGAKLALGTGDLVPALLLGLAGVACGAVAAYCLSPKRRLKDIEP